MERRRLFTGFIGGFLPASLGIGVDPAGGIIVPVL